MCTKAVLASEELLYSKQKTGEINFVEMFKLKLAKSYEIIIAVG